MSNPFPKNGFFATPESLEQLKTMLQNIGDKDEQRIAWTAAALALNFANKTFEESKETA
jgi:hypothetical protein